jgi:hypothetical protein
MSKRPELERQLKPCLYIFQLFGLNFFNINDLFKTFDPNKSRKIPSVGYTLYFLILLTFVVGQNFMGFWEMQFGSQAEKLSVKTLIKIVMEMGIVSLFFFTAVVMIILSFATTHLQKSVFYNMLIIAERFELRLGRQISFKKLKITFLMKITLFIILYIGFLTIFNTMKIYDAYGIDKYLAWVGFTIIRITFTGKLFTLYADLIHHFLMNIESCINEAIVDKNLTKITSAFLNYHDFYERISAMKSIYGLIWDTTNLINRCMGKILLFLLTLGVVSVTAAGYKIFLIIVSNDPALDLIGKLSMNGGGFLCVKTDQQN